MSDTIDVDMENQIRVRYWEDDAALLLHKIHGYVQGSGISSSTADAIVEAFRCKRIVDLLCEHNVQIEIAYNEFDELTLFAVGEEFRYCVPSGDRLAISALLEAFRQHFDGDESDE